MLKIAICDDDKIFCSNFEKMLLKLHGENKIEIFRSGVMLFEALQKGAYYDLIFLDIEMPELNGVETGEKIRNIINNNTIQIVYVSAKSEYAMELFKIRPFDFLIKPIEFERLEKLLNNYLNIFIDKNQFFEFKQLNIFHRIPYREIIYFQSINKKIRIVTQDEEYTCYGKLSDLVEMVPKNMFLIIHKSFLMNYYFISESKYESVKIITGQTFSISQPYRSAVRDYLINRGKNEV